MPPVVAAGAGPQLLSVSSDGASVYLATYVDNSVSQYDVGTGGALAAKSPATVAAGQGPTHVAVAPDGTVYATERALPRVLRVDASTRAVTTAVGS